MSARTDRLLVSRPWWDGPLVALVPCGIAFAVVAAVGSRLIFFGDEWTWLVQRHGLTAATFLAPHNEHLSAIPVTLYLILRATVGLTTYLPYMSAVALANAAVGFCIFVLIRRRAGTRAALAGCVLFLAMGRAYENVFWAFQVSWDSALLGGLTAFLVIEDPAPLTRRRQLVVMLALLLCVGSSGAGLVMFALSGVSLLLRVRRRAWELWPAAVPGLLYLAWYLTWGRTAVRAQFSLVGDLQYMVKGIGASILGAVGLGSHQSTTAVLLATALAAVAMVAGFRPTRRTWFGVVGLLATFALLASVRVSLGTDQAASNRYIYSGAIYLAMLATEAVVWLRTRVRRRVVRPVLVGLFAIVLVSNLAAGVQAIRLSRNAATRTKTAIGTLQFFRGAADLGATVVLDPIGMPGVPASVAYPLFDRYGVPKHVDTRAQWAALPPDLADAMASQLFLRALRVRPVTSPPGGCQSTLDAGSTRLADGASITVRASAPVTAQVWLSVTGAAPQPAAVLSLAAGEAARITVPTSTRHLGWLVQVPGAADHLTRCSPTG